MSRPFAWSYSRLNNFETCPKKYFHTSVAKDFVEPESDSMAYGYHVHSSLDKRISKGKRLPMDLSHLEPVAAKFANATGEKLTEQKLAITKDYKPTGWFDDDVWCRAIVDLAIVSDHTAVLVDWKTGKIGNDFTQLSLCSAIFFLHNTTVHRAQMVFYWTKHKKPTTGVLLREEAPQVWSDLLPRVAKLETAHERTDFPARPSGICRRHCPVKTCPYHGNGTAGTR